MFTQGTHADIKSSLNAIGAAVAMFELDEDDRFILVSANDTFAQAFELDVVGSIGKRLGEMFPRYITGCIEPPMNECVTQQTGLESELPIDTLSRTSWWRFVISPIMSEHSRISRIMVTAIDITTKKQLEEALKMSRKRFEAVVNSAYDGIISVNSESRIELINTAACEMFGIDESYIGKRLETLLPQRFRAHHEGYFKSFSNSPINSRPMHARSAVMGLRRDGSEFPLEVTIAKINLGQTTEMTAILRDISERARLVEELKVAATTDPLTGIANRRRIDEMLHLEMQRSQRFSHTMSLLLIDIDHFKQINDTYGHQQGDRAILSLVKRIARQLREVTCWDAGGARNLSCYCRKPRRNKLGAARSGSARSSNQGFMSSIAASKSHSPSALASAPARVPRIRSNNWCTGPIQLSTWPKSRGVTAASRR